MANPIQDLQPQYDELILLKNKGDQEFEAGIFKFLNLDSTLSDENMRHKEKAFYLLAELYTNKN